jgi:hypothetical protein
MHNADQLVGTLEALSGVIVSFGVSSSSSGSIEGETGDQQQLFEHRRSLIASNLSYWHADAVRLLCT